VDWQLLIVGVIVAGAAGYLARQTWRTWSGKKSGCGGCSCKSTTASASQEQTPLIPAEQLTWRRRLGPR
jgi:hypothetical protein